MEYTSVDIPTLQQLATQYGEQNIQRSQAIEQQFDPNLAKTRKVATQQLADFDTGGYTPQQQAILRGIGQYKTVVQKPDFIDTSGIDALATQAQEELELGGTLNREQYNEAARRAGVISGVSGVVGSDIATREATRQSQQVYGERIQNAQNIGQVKQSIDMSNVDMANQYQMAQMVAQNSDLERQLNVLNLQQQNRLQTFQNIYQKASVGYGIQAPQGGIDPASLANITLQNQYGAQNFALQQQGLELQQKNAQNQAYVSMAGTAITLAVAL